MKSYDYNGTEVFLERASYHNGTLAVLMNDKDGNLYEVLTVNLCHPLQSDSMAFLDENNLPGIGEWVENNNLGISMGVNVPSGFCRYPLFTLFSEQM